MKLDKKKIVRTKIQDYHKPIQLTLSAKVHLSEDPDKVKEAMLNIFPSFSLEMKGEMWIGVAKDINTLKRFSEKISKMRILDAVRRHLLKEHQEGVTRCFLHKQAAFAQRLSICPDPSTSPLGPIILDIEAKDIQELIDSFFPKWEWIKPEKHSRKHYRENDDYEIGNF